MKCQILFPGKNKKNISKCGLLKIIPECLTYVVIMDWCYYTQLISFVSLTPVLLVLDMPPFANSIDPDWFGS